jgi:uncharacterized protein
MLLNNIEQKIIEEFVKNKSNRVYGNEFAKRFNLNQKTISNNLHGLEKKEILKSKTEGKNKYFFINSNNYKIKEILKIVEIFKKIEFVKSNASLKNLFAQLEQNATGILIVFGSYAKFLQKKSSDLDLLVIGKIDKLKHLEESFGIEINLVSLDKNKFNLNEPFIKEIMENHIILKGTEEFIDLIW